MEIKSNKFLKVTGILLIIAGAFGIIGGVIAVLGASALAALFAGEVNLGLLVFASVLTLVSAVISLIAGILGVVNAAKPEKAGQCIVFGILIIIFSILGNILSVVAGADFSVMNLILGLVLPVLYLIGAFQSKKSLEY